LYRRIVGLDLPDTRIDQSIGLCYDDDACSTCSPQQKIDSSELMQCNDPGRGEASLLYLVMVILRVSYEYGLRVYPRVGSGRVGSGRVAIFGTGRVRVRVG